MKKLIFILSLFFIGCAAEEAIESNDNPFLSYQKFYIVNSVGIDVVLDTDSRTFDVGKNKFVSKVSVKTDPLLGFYKYKYLAFQKGHPSGISIYSNSIMKEDVHVLLYKYSENQNVNCRVNNIPCFCIYE